MKRDLRGLSIEECEVLMQELGEPKFRGKQLFQWVQKGIVSFDEMKNLPAALRNKLEETSRLDPLTLLRQQKSKWDGTQKFLFAVDGGDAIESVFMKYKYGNSICVSSQAGCRMGCAFCASGINGLSRNLTAAEILSEIMDVERITGEPINHVVIMGTGEPFDNYSEVANFLRLLNDKMGRNMSYRNITVSTCGLIPGIKQFAEDFPQVNLAISLHAPNDETRSKTMPVDKKYPFPMLISACREYTEKTHRRITFEYALIRGVNDREEDAVTLAKALRGMLCHVNLIPLNEVKETGFQTAGVSGAKRFQVSLENLGIPVTIRRQLGQDIDGACGQLRLENSK